MLVPADALPLAVERAGEPQRRQAVARPVQDRSDVSEFQLAIRRRAFGSERAAIQSAHSVLSDVQSELLDCSFVAFPVCTGRKPTELCRARSLASIVARQLPTLKFGNIERAQREDQVTPLPRFSSKSELARPTRWCDLNRHEATKSSSTTDEHR